MHNLRIVIGVIMLMQLIGCASKLSNLACCEIADKIQSVGLIENFSVNVFSSKGFGDYLIVTFWSEDDIFSQFGAGGYLRSNAYFCGDDATLIGYDLTDSEIYQGGIPWSNTGLYPDKEYPKPKTDRGYEYMVILNGVRIQEAKDRNGSHGISDEMPLTSDFMKNPRDICLYFYGGTNMLSSIKSETFVLSGEEIRRALMQ